MSILHRFDTIYGSAWPPIIWEIIPKLSCTYAEYFSNVWFCRVIKDFMVQGGDFVNVSNVIADICLNYKI